MKDILLKGIKTFFTTMIVCVISFFLVVSFNAIKIGLFSENIGYDVYGKTEDKTDPEYLYTYYIDDGKDEKAEDYEKQGYELVKYSIRSEVEKTPDIICGVLSQIFCLTILASFIYSELWKTGNKDFEAERLYGTPINIFKGMLIGFVAVIPSIAFLIFSLITQNSVMAKLPIAIFTFANCYAYEIIFSVTNGAMFWADVQWWQALVYFAVLLIIPIIAFVSYYIGCKDISISEKLIYKNSKKRG